MAENITTPLPDLATNSLAAFEKYLDREPLNDELAGILAGESDGAEPLHPAEVADGVTRESTTEATPRTPRGGLLDWTPSRKQLGDLAETVGSEGWAVFLDLMKKRLEVLRETAITVSQNDPLRNKDAVADEWAYHGIYRKVVNEMQPMVHEQLARLRVAE